MQESFYIIPAYFVTANVITFALFAYDKYCAKHDKWRVRESTLLIWAAIGGTVGAIAAMEICHHKTLHLKFKYGIPLLFFLQIILIGLIYFNPGNILEKILADDLLNLYNQFGQKGLIR